MPALSDLELLRIEMDLLWEAEAGPDLVVASARDGLQVRVGKRVPDEVAPHLVADIDANAPATAIDAPPPRLEYWRTMLEDAFGAAVRLLSNSGPSYVIPDDVSFPPSTALVRSDAEDLAALRSANPGNWGADEWEDLLDGRLGPWVMATHDQRVVSICHTPKFNARAADAGVWTHPQFRGRGLAAATTAEWAALVRPTGRVLFYSTSRANRSSQRVAARLGLRHIGYLWQLQSTRNASGGWTDPRVRARVSTIEGSGLYAAAPIRAGEIVFMWGGGRIITDAELRANVASGRRYSSAAIGEDQNILWETVDANAGGPGGVNHSCDPNLWMLDERTLCARRDIGTGEELSTDYALFTVSSDWQMECHCGAASCRRLITGSDWQLPTLQQRYAGHFSPFINARIAAAAHFDSDQGRA